MEQKKISKVIVVGGGPSGLFISILLKRIVEEVIVIEKKHYPIDKVCGEGLMPRAVQLLKDQKILGQDFFENKNNYFAFSGVNFSYQNSSVEGEFPQGLKGMGIKRSVLSNALYQKAIKSGVVFYNPANVTSISNQQNGATVDYFFEGEKSLQADLVLLCDGLHSSLKRKLGIGQISLYPSWLKYRGKHPLRLGARLHYQATPWSKNVEVYWKEGIEAYVTPLSDQLIGVSWLFDSRRFQSNSNPEIFLQYFPEILKKLKGATSLDDFLVFGPLGLKSEKGHWGNICLLGDSFAFYDGITGEGLASCFSEAHIFYQKINDFQLGKLGNFSQTLQEFENERQKILDLTCNHCTFTLYLSISTFIKKIIFRFLAEFPYVFKKIMEIQVAGKKINFKNLLGL